MKKVLKALFGVWVGAALITAATVEFYVFSWPLAVAIVLPVVVAGVALLPRGERA